MIGLSGTMKWVFSFFLAFMAVTSISAFSDTYPSNLRLGSPDMSFAGRMYLNARLANLSGKDYDTEMSRLKDISDNLVIYLMMYREGDKFREKVIDNVKRVILDSGHSEELINKAIKDFELLDHFVRTVSEDDAYRTLQLEISNVLN